MNTDSVVANFAHTAGYPFQAEWEQTQSELLPEFSGWSLFGNNEPSPLTKERLPERQQETNDQQIASK